MAMKQMIMVLTLNLVCQHKAIIKFKVLILVSALLLSGCSLFVSENSFGESWKGETLGSLMSQWGEPVERNAIYSGGTEAVYKIFNDSCTYYFYTNLYGH